jgi:hypothetical protein
MSGYEKSIGKFGLQTRQHEKMPAVLTIQREPRSEKSQIHRAGLDDLWSKLFSTRTLTAPNIWAAFTWIILEFDVPHTAYQLRFDQEKSSQGKGLSGVLGDQLPSGGSLRPTTLCFIWMVEQTWVHYVPGESVFFSPRKIP